jgi:hypothetical protein
MLKWFKNLYVGDTVTKQENRIIWKVNHGVGVWDVYLITLATNSDNLLDIISANMLLQKTVRRSCPLIVGLAFGYEEALQLVEQIVSEVYQKTGAVAVRQYIEQQLRN